MQHVRLCGREQHNRYSDLLRAGRSEDRIPVGAKFSAPVHSPPWGPTSLLYKGYRVSFPKLKQWGRGVDHPLRLAPRLKKE